MWKTIILLAGAMLPATEIWAQSAALKANEEGPDVVSEAGTPNGSPVPGVTPAQTPSAVLPATPDQWRYVRHDNWWWYYTPQNTWLYWTGAEWAPFQGAVNDGMRSYRSGAYDSRYYGNGHSNYGPGVSGGYLSPNGPSSRANQFRVPFYMRADRRVLGMYP